MSLKLQKDKARGCGDGEVLEQTGWGRGGGSAAGDWIRKCQEQFRSS